MANTISGRANAFANFEKNLKEFNVNSRGTYSESNRLQKLQEKNNSEDFESSLIEENSENLNINMRRLGILLFIE